MPQQRLEPPPPDWYSWLRRAGLDPPAALDCAALLRRQELEPADAPDFDHDLLRTAGVAVAKHRLQILRHAKKEARGPTPITLLRGLVSAAAGRLASWCRRRSAGASSPTSCMMAGPTFVMPPSPISLPAGKARWAARGSEWGGGGGMVVAGLLRPTTKRMLKLAGSRGKVAAAGPPSPLPLPFPCAPVPILQGTHRKKQRDSDKDSDKDSDSLRCGGGGGSSTAPDEKEMRWDAMFQDLKPT